MSAWLLHTVIFLVVFFAMEGVAWATHKYLMHGPLWFLHRDHHDTHPEDGSFWWELNDVFGAFFSVIAISLFTLGYIYSQPLFTTVAIGITAYGAVYFFAHDILVHRRVALRINPRKGYLRRLYQAHRLHHAVEGRKGCVSFGFIFAPSPEHLKQQIARLAPLRQKQRNRVDVHRRSNNDL